MTDLSSVSAGLLMAVTVAVSSFEVTGLPAKLADAVAWLVTDAGIEVGLGDRVRRGAGDRRRSDQARRRPGRSPSVRSSVDGERAVERRVGVVGDHVGVRDRLTDVRRRSAGDAVLSSCSCGACAVSAVAVSAGDVVVPDVAVAVLTTAPAFRSAWVTVYVARAGERLELAPAASAGR